MLCKSGMTHHSGEKQAVVQSGDELEPKPSLRLSFAAALGNSRAWPRQRAMELQDTAGKDEAHQSVTAAALSPSHSNRGACTASSSDTIACALWLGPSSSL